MQRINHKIVSFSLLIIGLSLTLFNVSNTHAEQSTFNSSDSLIALRDDIDHRIYSLNNIYFVDSECRNGGSSSSSNYGASGTCGQNLTATDATARLKEAVEKFGGFTIDMQVEYGVPWEAVFFHMYGESQMGLAGLAKEVEKCGYYNTMGYVYSGSSLYGITEDQMGNCAPHHGDNGALAAQFPSYEDMIMSYYTDYARNGLYDKAFDSLDPNNYDLEGFLKTESDIYSAAGWDGRVPGYGAYKDVWYSIKDTIYDVAKEKGWPTSKELAKEKNIPIGGKYPVNGDIKKQINAAPHSLSACNGSGSVATPDTDDGSSDDKDSSEDKEESSDKKEDSDSSSAPSGTSFKINPNTPAGSANEEGTGGFWYLEGPWSQYTVKERTTIHTNNENIVTNETKIDKDFFDMPYIYAENYDFTYSYPVKMTPNGKKSTRKYYWMVLPNEAYAVHMGDLYVAYFEKREEPVYFIIYDVWACEHHHLRGMAYCDWARENPDDVNGGLANNSLGHFSERGWEANNQLGDALGKLTCLHRITTEGDTLAHESVQCSGATCTPTTQDYPEYRQQTDHTCGPTSMAMLATVAAGKEISESDVIGIVGSDRAYADTVGSGMVTLDKKVGDKYDFTVEQVSVNEGSKQDVIDKMRDYLKKGYMIHFSGCGSTPPISDHGSCHYLGIFNIDKDDNVFVADSSGRGNKTYKLSDVINAGYHGDSFSAIQGSGTSCSDSGSSSNNDRCPTGSSSSGNSSSAAGGSCSTKILQSVDDILDLAKKNGYDYAAKGHDADGSSYFDSILKNNAKVEVDCTGFASLVMYATFGVKETFWTGSIAGNSNYVEVPKSDIQPGDIFNYNSGCTAHGGIVVEVKDGTVTKIAQTGRPSIGGYNMVSGVAGTNNPEKSLGYFEDPDGVNSNLQCVNGKATDLKFYRYKGCK